MSQYEESQNKLLTEILPRVAAQLRGSLGNIHGALGCMITAQEREDDPSLDRYTAILEQSYYRIMRVVNNLTAAPLLAEDTMFTLENVELVEWLRDLCRQAETLAETNGVRLVFQTQMRNHVAAIHSGHMERLVWNLLSNALKFTPDGGQITVTLSVARKQVLLCVEDTGCGIPQEQQETVFERYLHANYMEPMNHGLGLGLPLCRRIAQGHGGRLLLQSQEGRGTKVTVAFPDQRTTINVVRDVPFQYAGGFQPIMMELSDALSYRAFTQKYLD